MIPTITSYLLPRILSGFSHSHGQVNVRVVEEITPVLLDRLHESGLDMAIVALPVQGEDLSCIDLFEEHFYAALPENHPKAVLRSISLEDLKGEPFLLLKEGHCFRDSMIAACHESGMRPHVVFESGQFSTILAMVASGMGVSAVPAMAIQPQPGCRFIRISNKRSVRRVGVIKCRYHFETRAQKVFIDHVLETCRGIHFETPKQISEMKSGGIA